MAYETGTVTGQTDLIDKLDTFIGTLGNWTVESKVAAPDDAADKQLHVSFYDSGESGESAPENQDIYCTFVSRVNAANPRFRFQPSLAYDNTKSILLQPSSPSATTTPFVSLPPSSSMTYWFFAEDTYLIIVLSISGGWYQTLFFGKPTLFGIYKNGYCAMGSCEMSAYGVNTTDYDYTTSVGDRHTIIGFTASTSVEGGYILKSDDSWVELFESGDQIRTPFSRGSKLERTSFELFTKNPPNAIFPTLLPIDLWDESVTNTYEPIGYFPSLYYVCLDGILANTEITIAADNYLLFPWWTQSTELGGEPAYNRHGYAIKKVT